MNLEVPISQNQQLASPALDGPKKARCLKDHRQKNRYPRSRLNRSCDHGSGLGQAGQVVVEYVLLLVASVVLAMLITRLMVGRDPGNPGFVISAWNAIVEEIGADHADDIRR